MANAKRNPIPSVYSPVGNNEPGGPGVEPETKELIMSTETTTVAPEAPKTEKKAASPKKPTSKKVKAAPKASTNGKPKTEGGLRKPQIRIIKVLAKGRPMSRAQIAEKAPVDVAGCVEWIGSHDERTRKANDRKHFPSLITLGLVRLSNISNNEDVVGAIYEITAKGRAEAAKS